MIHIFNTDINSGLEYLTHSVEIMLYSTKEWSTFQLKFIEQQLKAQILSIETYDPKNWKTYWNKFIQSKLEKTRSYRSIQLQFNQCFKAIEKKLTNWQATEKNEVRINTLKQMLAKVTIEQAERQAPEWKELKKILKKNRSLNYYYDLTKISQFQLQLNKLTENNVSFLKIMWFMKEFFK